MPIPRYQGEASRGQTQDTVSSDGGGGRSRAGDARRDGFSVTSSSRHLGDAIGGGLPVALLFYGQVRADRDAADGQSSQP
jgi:hypothetical protein